MFEWYNFQNTILLKQFTRKDLMQPLVARPKVKVNQTVKNQEATKLKLQKLKNLYRVILEQKISRQLCKIY